MTESSLLQRIVGQPLEAFTGLPADQRAAAVRAVAPDLHAFFAPGVPLDQRDAPARSLALARDLAAAITAGPGEHAGLTERIVTDTLLRGEADRDQNVYLGGLFTRSLTRAVPDLVFLPATVAEVAAAMRWARGAGVPVTLRGAASTAMGGAVPHDGGMALDLAKLDRIDVDIAAGVASIGAGARLRTIHTQLAAAGLALQVYPSNLGGTLAGWFATGGIGLNAFGRGRALDHTLSADVLLPTGDHVRLHADGRVNFTDGTHRREMSAGEAAGWFAERHLPALTLADLAGSEGVLGAILQLTVRVMPRPEIGAFLLAFDHRDTALQAALAIAEPGSPFGTPANLKLLSGSHLDHVRHVWADDDARAWRADPGALTSTATLPWTGITGPAALGAQVSPEPGLTAAYLYVDFLDLDAARAFAAALPTLHVPFMVLGAESVRFAAERFRPQMTKRLGPGLLAAEILMPAAELERFLPRAEQLAQQSGNNLDAEVYLLPRGETLVIGAFLTDHRHAGYLVDLVLAPVLVDLAMRDHHGRPYVLGRWQAAWGAHTLGRTRHARLAQARAALDPDERLNRGVLLRMRLRGVLGWLLGATFVPGIRMMRELFFFPGLVTGMRALLDRFPGPAFHHGAPVHAPAPAAVATPAPSTNGTAHADPASRALHCVNCGECNSVCPIFAESKVRLPQMLTHLGEAMAAGQAVPASGSVLLDLCMRCGNCEEVCQAGIPHLPLYEQLQRASDAVRPRDRERHVAILSAVRGSHGYLREFLQVRPGGYQKRAPASLPGMVRFLLLRAENDDGPAATCIHCGACVGVCPTGANHEFEGADPRVITTDQARCIGCGTCVEVCPANHLNGGRTLRVMEAPAHDFLAAVDAFERGRT